MSTTERSPANARLTLGDRATAGAIAGLVLLVVECAASTALGGSPVAPPRLVASALVGPGALSPAFPLPGPLAVGGGVFIAFGILCGLVSALVLPRTQRRLIPAILIGIAFGTTLWIVDGLTLGPILFGPVSVLDLVWQGFVAHAMFGIALTGLLIRAQRG